MGHWIFIEMVFVIDTVAVVSRPPSPLEYTRDFLTGGQMYKCSLINTLWPNDAISYGDKDVSQHRLG